MPHPRVLLALLATFALALTACGDSDDSPADATSTTDADPGSTTSTTAGATTGSATSTTSVPGGSPGQVERIQTQLTAVGCFSGAIDGLDGPETAAAVEAFQEAQDLAVDGVPGPETQGALDSAVANGEMVCTADDGAGAVGDSTVELSSVSYSAGFTVSSCDNPTGSTLVLSAENQSLIELDVMATDGTGTLSVSGGTGEDSIALTGDVESVAVGDAAEVNITGTFTGDNLAGETFTITGSCA